jgi:hypothetical protein
MSSRRFPPSGVYDGGITTSFNHTLKKARRRASQKARQWRRCLSAASRCRGLFKTETRLTAVSVGIGLKGALLCDQQRMAKCRRTSTEALGGQPSEAPFLFSEPMPALRFPPPRSERTRRLFRCAVAVLIGAKEKAASHGRPLKFGPGRIRPRRIILKSMLEVFVL